MLKRVEEFKIPEEDPFKNDLLDRKTIAQNLTTLVENTTTPYVMSISAPWGQGKTTFIQMWQKMLEQRGFATVYFDAWSSDYANDPLLAFINAIDSAVTEDDTPAKRAMDRVKTTLKNVVKASPKIALNWVLRGGLNFITDGDEDAEDEINAISQIAEKLIEQEMAKFAATRQVLEDFGNKLSELGETMGDEGKPLVIFVDELDRCRPDYAVELLERIKHLFAVENILVVLSVDTEKLGYTASQVIGFSPDDTDGYLRRFIDLDYRLPFSSLVGLIRSQLNSHDLPNEYRTLDTAKTLAALANLRRLSARDCLLITNRFAATARSFPNIYVGYSQFLSIAVLESYHDNDALGLALSDPIKANERLRDLKSWRDAISGDEYHEERHIRSHVFSIYAGWMVDLDDGTLEEEEKKQILQWSQRAFDFSGRITLRKQYLFQMIDYADSFQ